MAAALVLSIVKGVGEGASLRVTHPRRVIVGRGDGADWKIEDKFVSRRHILLEISPPACRLQDLGFGESGSLNAPRVNGRPVRCCELKHGDILDLGLTRVRMSVERLPEDASPAFAAEPARAWARGPTEEVFCHACGAPLSREANSDGRAGELRGCVSYVCAACLPPGDRSAGTIVGPYELRRLIGAGGMGAVYLAYERATARLVALKRIEDVEDQDAVRRFAREVRVLSRMAHPLIVRFVETGVDGAGTPFVVTEYVPGGNLEDYMRRTGKPAVQTGVDLIRQVLEALQYLHTWPVIHRDIKPENILLRPSAELGAHSVALADFGISSYYELAGGTRLTKPGTRMGTLMFMPPEQVLDAREAREPADTYATGVTLYYLLTGRYPFDFPTPAGVREFQARAAAFRSPDEAVRDIMRMERVRHPFRIVLEEEPIPVLARVPNLPRRLAAVVDKAVHKAAGQRFQTAAEFRAALPAPPSGAGRRTIAGSEL